MADNDLNKPNESLAHYPSGPLSHNTPHFTAGSLERAFLDRFPAKDAEPWDHTGLVVGDRTQSMTKIAFTLDPTVEAIEKAYELGANVLITHHPVFIEAPDRFEPKPSPILVSGAAVWAAIEKGVSLLSFHTALDVSTEASRVLPRLLNLDFKHIVQRLESSNDKGYGQMTTPKKEEVPLTLEQLAARCVSVFGRQPRVYGDFASRLENIVTCTGNANSIVADCLESHADCLICGEIRYHDALNASHAGMAIIDLGHDVSEWPLVSVLVATARDVGVSDSHIVIIDQKDNWTTPETIRM